MPINYVESMYMSVKRVVVWNNSTGLDRVDTKLLKKKVYRQPWLLWRSINVQVHPGSIDDAIHPGGLVWIGSIKEPHENSF